MQAFRPRQYRKISTIVDRLAASVKKTDGLEFGIIGPASSGTLLDMVNELVPVSTGRQLGVPTSITQQRLAFVSASATASTVRSETRMELFRKRLTEIAPKLTFLQTIGDDAQLITQIVNELKLRGIDPARRNKKLGSSSDYVAVVTELDNRGRAELSSGHLSCDIWRRRKSEQQQARSERSRL